MRIGNKVSAGSLLALCGVCCFSGTLNAEPVKAGKVEQPTFGNARLAPREAGPSTSNMNRKGPEVIYHGIGLEGGNDDCASAITVGVPSVTPGSTTGATIDAVPVCFTSITAPGVWYKVVGTGNELRADTCGFRTYDTKINVYTGSCANLICVADNDDDCSLGSGVNWISSPGTEYFIMVHGFSSGVGDFDLNITEVLPCNFSCPIGATPEDEPDCFDLYVDATNGGCNSNPPVFGSATINGGDVCGTGGNYLGLFDNFTPSNPNDDFVTNFRDTDWYMFTVSSPTEVTLTATASFDSLFGLIDLSAGCPVGSFLTSGTAAECGTVTLTRQLLPGTYVVFAGTSGFTGTPCGAEYTFNLTGVPFTPPMNDTCDQAIPVAINSTTSGSTAGTGIDLGLPTCGTSITAGGVWFTVVGDGTGLSADTCGFRDYDTKISVFCGDCNTGEFFCVGGNDDFCGLGSNVSWCSESGKLYYILVHGFGGATGAFDLNVFSDGVACGDAPLCAPCIVDPDPMATPEGEPDCFDFYVDATNGGCNSTPEVFGAISCGETVTGTAGHYLGLFDNFTPSNPNDDFVTNFRDTDWYLFTLDAPKEVTVSAYAEFDVLVGVVDLNAGCAGAGGFTIFNTGLSCTNTSATGILAPGTYVMFVGTSDFAGRPCGLNYNASLDCSDPVLPENDFCEDAISVAIGSSTSGSTSGATTDFDAGTCGGGTITSPGVWYKVTGNGNTLDANLCNAARSYDTKLNVYCGECGNLICVDGVDDSCDGLGSNITWCSEAGKEYLILVHGFGGATGGFQLDISDFGPGCTPSVTCPAGFCAADLTGSSDPNDPGYGVPDGLVDASDFFYYLDQFVMMNFAVADITGSSDPNDPTYGVPDGDIDADDFFVYLDRFVSCQP